MPFLGLGPQEGGGDRNKRGRREEEKEAGPK